MYSHWDVINKIDCNFETTKVMLCIYFCETGCGDIIQKMKRF
jgi:hypothetical protein